MDRLLNKEDAGWFPLPGPQMAAYISEADELFYGGSAGGGKSDLLLGLATTAHRNSIIFRREYPQLKGIIERSRELIGERGTFNATDNLWRLADGRRLEFGAVQYRESVTKYQGRPHDLECFDELPNFTEYQYRFLTGWTRTTIPGQRTRIVSAGNPPTSAEGEWVIRRWAAWLDGQHPHPAEPGELRWYATIDGEDREVDGPAAFTVDGELIVPKSRTFIPARLADNPFLVAAGYAATLQAMPEPLRSQMLYGDFAAGIDEDPWQIIPTEWVTLAQARWRERPKPDLPMTALGVDVARGGDDETVIAPRYGNWFGPLRTYPGTSTPNGFIVAAFVRDLHEGDAIINLDVVGVGGAVEDALSGGAGRSLRVNRVNFGAGSHGTDRAGNFGFANVRAEAWWAMREALDPVTGDDLALPPDPQLLADLCAPRWKPVARGIQVESKADIHQRIKRSPDRGDAVVLALCPAYVPHGGVYF